MIWQFSPYAVPLFAAVLAALVVVALVWARRHAPGGRTFIRLSILTIPWTLGDALAHLSVPVWQKYLFNQITYIGIATLPLLSFFFALEYTQQEHIVKPAQRRLLWIVPALTGVAALISPSLFGIWTTAHVQMINGYGVLVFGHGPLFWIYAAYGHSINLATTLILYSAILRFPAGARVQALALSFSILVPWLCNVAYLTGINPIPGLDVTPISFVLSFATWAWVLVARQLFSIVPIARHLLVERMTDGILVLDGRGRIVDNNPAARKLLNAPKIIVGSLLSDFFPAWETIKPNDPPPQRKNALTRGEENEEEVQNEVRVTATRQAADTNAGIETSDAATLLSLNVRLLPLRDQRGDPSGQLLILSDITERQRNMDALQAANHRLQAQIEENQMLQARLSDLAIRDDLTGLLNRRCFQQGLEAQIVSSREVGTPFVLMLLDLDGFKTINDRHGHRAGDDVLRAFTQVLRQEQSTNETPFRYGGEEFALLLFDCDRHSGLARAEAYRAACERMRIASEVTADAALRETRVTCSIGFAVYPDHGQTPDALLTLADAALYRAKRTGRNRVCEARPISDEPPFPGAGGVSESTGSVLLSSPTSGGAHPTTSPAVFQTTASLVAAR